MEGWLLAVIGIFTIIIILLVIKILLMQKSAKEIERAFEKRLATDTNALIDISSKDRSMRSLAAAVNIQLRTLRSERTRFVQGDKELKNAVTGISHDLRTPLTAIFGYLDLLASEELSGNVKRYVEIIRDRAEMLKQLTEELFRYSVILTEEEKSAGENIDIGEVLEDSVAAFYTAFRSCGIEPNIKMPENKVFRTLDRADLSRVFSNLLNNAVKYSTGDLEITLSENGELLFSNTAPALSEVQVGRLFDRFYTVDTARNSTGLGLSIAKTLAERMGGTIDARYREGRLCVFLSFQDRNC